MTDKYTINYTEQQLREWVAEHVNFTKKQLKTSEAVADYVSFLPPPKIFKNISHLVKDEGVNPDDISVNMLTEDNNSIELNLSLGSVYEMVYTDPLSA